MSIPDILKFVSCCKDYLHAEWAIYKKLGEAKSLPVCIYSIGGSRDISTACLESIGNGFKELERILRECVNLNVDKSTPIISQDIMVWANGHITLFPERNFKSASTSSTPSPEVKPLPVPGRKPKTPQTPEAAFMVGVEQIANYMLDHLKRISEACLLVGNIKILYMVLSSAALVKCRVLTYKQVLKAPTTKALTSAINRCNETIDIITQHLLNYQSDIIRSSVLQDANSHDWTNEKPYQENEQISLSIQMWAFYIQGIRNDLWRSTPPKMAETIFNNILTDTLSLLVTRYTQIEPSDLRLCQMRGDITAIFFVVSSILFSLVSTPNLLFEGNIHRSIVFSIHRRMDLLLRVSAIMCAPIEALAKVYSHGIFASKKCSKNTKDVTQIVSCPEWLTFFNPKLFPPDVKKLSVLPDNVAVYLTLNNAALRPFPNQGLIVRGLIMRDFLGTKTILKGLQDLPAQVEKGQPCGGALCLGYLCTPPLIPHTVYSAIVQIVIRCSPSSDILMSVMQDEIRDSGNWDSLDRTQVWNIQRPPWHHALVQIVGQHVAAVVSQVLHSVPPKPPAQPAHPSQVSVRLEHHLSAWTLQLIIGVENLANTLPLCLIQLSQSINSILPPTIKPVGGHVISQLVISAIYSIVNSRTSLDQLGADGPITDGQWDMMIAVGERLCSLHEGNFEKALTQMTKTLLHQYVEISDDNNLTYRLNSVEEDDADKIDDYHNEEVIEMVCQQMADQVLSSPQGQHAFGIVWEYLKRNMAWVAPSLGVPPLLLPPASSNDSTRTIPIPRMSFGKIPSIYNPLYYHNHVLYTTFNQEYLMGFEGNWEMVLGLDLWLSKDMIQELIKKRPEMKPDAVLTPLQATAVRKLKFHLRSKKLPVSEVLDRLLK